MSEFFRRATLIAATLATGLMAGLYFAFAVAVMPGLGGRDDRTFVGAMQEFNVAIVNGPFLLVFLGGIVLTALAGVLQLRARNRSVLLWIVAGLVLYLAGFIITIGVNIPLNDELAAAGDPDQIADLAAVRERFESAWVGWNIVRTVVTTAALGVLSWALVQFGRVRTS